jgi:hypothetical protein
MTDQVLPTEEAQPLSQVERVVDTFIAPIKTFTDVLRSTSWWLPFLLAVIVSAASAFAIDKNVGFDRVAEQQVAQSPSQADRLAQLTPDARAAQMHGRAVGTKYSTYASGVFILLITAIFALLNWAGLNFGLGAKTTFGQNFAVAMYASLPRLFIGLLNIVFLYAGVNTENFDLSNPVGTNLGYYLTDSPHWIRTSLTFFDIFGLWTLVLSVIGCAIIARKSYQQAAYVVVGWWLFFLVLTAGLVKVFS